jgi:hypothetical protein
VEEMGGDGRRWEEMGGDGRRWEEMGGDGRRSEEIGGDRQEWEYSTKPIELPIATLTQLTPEPLTSTPRPSARTTCV